MIDSASNVSIIQYLLQFTGIYLAVNIAVIAFVYFTHENLTSFVPVLSVIVAAMISGQRFANKQLRLMNRGERLKFSVFAIPMAVLASFMFAAVVFEVFRVPFTYKDIVWEFGVRGIPDWVWILVWLFAFAITVIVAYFSINIIAKVYVKN